MKKIFLMLILCVGVVSAQLKIYKNMVEVNDSNWTDLTIPATLINPVGSPAPPTINDSTGTLKFANGAINSVAVIFQVPHDYKQGTNVHFHVHWYKNTNNSGTVIWKTKYKWANPGEVFPNFSALTEGVAQISDSNTPFKHAITDWVGWSGSGKTVSNILIVYLERTGTSDTFTGNAELVSVDIHYQRDRFGSSTEWAQ